jgi:hypothetical protein
MITDLIYNKDKYHELFTSVINLLEDGSLTPTPQLREFIDLVEIARSKANSAIIRAIRKSDMDASKKAKLEKLHQENQKYGKRNSKIC